MNDKAFARLEEVVLDPIFPEVDVALRQGRHIDRDEGDSYAFLLDAQDTLEPFYMRYGWDLIHASDGFFYLLPRGDQLGQRHLSVGEMLVGQTLALMYLDPTTLQAGGVVQRPQLVARLAGLIGERELVSALNPRRRACASWLVLLSVLGDRHHGLAHRNEPRERALRILESAHGLRKAQKWGPEAQLLLSQNLDEAEAG